MTATEAEMGWFAGILEGEGSITFFKQPRKNGKFDVIVGINITNTDISIINKLTEILMKNDLSWFIREKQVYKKNHSRCFFIETRQHAMVKKSLETFLPYMVGEKKAKAEIVIRYLNKRFERTGGKKCGNIPYTEDELTLIPRGHM